MSEALPAAEAYAYPLLIKQLLHTPRATARMQEIVYADKRRMTYSDFFQRLGRYGSLLAHLGVGRGETVAVMDWDSHRYLESFFAVPMYGAVLLTVNVRLSPEQIAYTINHAEAGVLLVNAEFLPLLEQIKGELKTVHRYVLLSDEPMPLPAGFAGEYEALLAAAHGDYEFPDFDENTRATTFYTTGTTGLPKGVYFSHRQLVLHTLAVTSALALSPAQGRFHRGDVYMALTPMFHVHAWGFPYIATLAGVKQVYPGRYQPESLLRLKAKEGVTFSHCVPTILAMLLNSPLAKDVDFSGWKMVIGGAAFPGALAQAALERGIDVFAGYGMSETCPVLTLVRVAEDQDSADRVEARTRTGHPIPLVELRTIDSDFVDVPRDGQSVGEVVVRAPWLTQGYLGNPGASDDLWAGGYLHTQDIGHLDEDGCLRITDRLKDVIKTGGEWVSSLALEDLIARCPGVAEVAVIAVPDTKWGERPAALVVKKPEAADLDADAVRAQVAEAAAAGQVSRYAVPAHVWFVEALDRTSVGKLNKRALREKYKA